MILKNDRSLELYNGDVGIIWEESDEGKIKNVYFPSAKSNSGFVKFPYSVLPEHEVVYAMTIHKSQGSGFENVITLLPNKSNELLTRELLYTAITRAKKYVELWANENVFKEAVKKQTKRTTGLKNRLDIVEKTQ